MTDRLTTTDRHLPPLAYVCSAAALLDRAVEERP